MRRQASSGKGSGRLSLKRIRTANHSSDEPQNPSLEPLAAAGNAQETREGKQERCRGCVGIANLGQTCFISAAAQALYHCPSFRSALVERPHHLLSPLFASMKESSDALDMMHDRQQQQQQQHEDDDAGRNIRVRHQGGGGLDGAISPDDLVAAVRLLQNGRFGAGQQDAHDLLLHLLDEWQPQGADKNVEDGTGGQGSGGGGGDGGYGGYGGDGWGGGPLLGSIMQSVSCCECETSATREEGFTHISLPSIARHSLPCLLSHHLSPSRISGVGGKYDCSQCLTKTEARVTHTITCPPRLLLLHLRKGCGAAGGGLAAIPERLSLARWCREAGGRGAPAHNYSLVSCVVHVGSTPRCGHYTAACKIPGQGWVHMDDSSCQVMGLGALSRLMSPLEDGGKADVGQASVYMAFYDCDS